MTENPKATAKALLAQHGQSMHPEAEVLTMDPPTPGTHAPVIVLERVVRDVLPDYCVHGYVTCVRCSALCWLGDQTKEIVVAGTAFPFCIECATEVIPPEQQPMTKERVEDRRRHEGPH